VKIWLFFVVSWELVPLVWHVGVSICQRGVGVLGDSGGGWTVKWGSDISVLSLCPLLFRVSHLGWVLDSQV
jgi:hypothetical protein